VALSFLFLFPAFADVNLFDSSNIGQARLNGLVTDLFTPTTANHDYQIAITCLYVPYIIFEVPSNLLIKKVTPAIWLPGLLTAWGIVSTLQGIVTSKTGLFVNRAFLGFAEAGVLPGISLWLTLFYRPEEIMLRQAIYFSGASLSGAFSGLLSVAIGKMNGISGLSGWQWIFIVSHDSL
jgi:MFS family permease